MKPFEQWAGKVREQLEQLLKHCVPEGTVTFKHPKENWKAVAQFTATAEGTQVSMEVVSDVPMASSSSVSSSSSSYSTPRGGG